MIGAIDETTDSDPPVITLPRRITRRWLAGLSDSELREVKRLLYADSGNYQSFSDARIISDRS